MKKLVVTGIAAYVAVKAYKKCCKKKHECKNAIEHKEETKQA